MDLLVVSRHACSWAPVHRTVLRFFLKNSHLQLSLFIYLQPCSARVWWILDWGRKGENKPTPNQMSLKVKDARWSRRGRDLYRPRRIFFAGHSGTRQARRGARSCPVRNDRNGHTTHKRTRKAMERFLRLIIPTPSPLRRTRLYSRTRAWTGLSSAGSTAVSCDLYKLEYSTTGLS